MLKRGPVYFVGTFFENFFVGKISLFRRNSKFIYRMSKFILPEIFVYFVGKVVCLPKKQFFVGSTFGKNNFSLELIV